jgi:hypothetical protein
MPQDLLELEECLGQCGLGRKAKKGGWGLLSHARELHAAGI